jgi:NADPH:quinone reductase-like Zn-dependent oxidoreductase
VGKDGRLPHRPLRQRRRHLIAIERGHPRWFGGPLSADYLTDRLGANLDGMLAEYAVLSEEAIVPVPKHLSFETIANVMMRRI